VNGVTAWYVDATPLVDDGLIVDGKTGSSVAFAALGKASPTAARLSTAATRGPTRGGRNQITTPSTLDHKSDSKDDFGRESGMKSG
jgi:hypothetical protein